jgi:YVTN family beta-propeller protein
VSNSGEATVQRFNPGTFEQGAVRDYGVGRRPAGIAYGEGAIWVANTSDDSVTRIDPAAGSNRTIDVGRGPTAVAVGSGSVWVANTADNTVSRIDPATYDVVETIEIGNAPYGIGVSDELVWITVQAP